MKKLTIKFGVLFLAIIIIFGAFGSVNAEDVQETKAYTLLTPLPGIGDKNKQTILKDYLPQVFNLTIGIAAGLAFVMLTFGGVMYAVSDSITGKNDGKKYIENALWGLLLVIGAYTILYTINPQILKFDLSIPRPQIKSGIPTVTPGVKMTDEQKNDDNNVRLKLLSPQIDTKKACVKGETVNCVNLNGLPDTAITGLKSLTTSEGCGCSIFISGGTEGGHATHGADAPIVDLRAPNSGLNTYILGSASNPTDKTTRVKTLPNGQRATFTFETTGGNANGTSSGDHWHVVIQ